MCLSLDYFLHFVSFTVASSSNTSSTDPKDSHADTIGGVTGGVLVVVVVVGVVIVRKKAPEGGVVKGEVRLSPSSDKQDNANNAPPSNLMVQVKNNKVSPTHLEMNENKVSPTYNDYVVYALPTCYRVMPHRPVFVGEWEHKYPLWIYY